MITIKPTIPGGSTQTFGADATITLEGSYNGGACIDGSLYVVAPAGIKVTGSSPTPGPVDGRAGHGIQANLTQAGQNGLDEGTTFSAGAALANGTVLPKGSCIVKVQSSDPRDPASGDIGRAGLFEKTTAMYVVAAPPSANAMAPVVWPSGDLANRPWRVADLDGFLSGLPVLASSGAPTWASLQTFWDKLDFGHGWAQGIRYQYLTPRRITNTDSAYGQYRAIVSGQVWGGICSNEWSTADKTAALIRALSNGCQITEAYAATGNIVGEDGGQFQWYLAECLAWLKATGRQSQYGTVMPMIGGNVRGQYYQVTAGQFSVHSSTSLPYIARRRTVSAITGTGPYVVTCTGYRPGSGLTEDTHSNGTFGGLNMVRETNGATGLITAQANNGADWDLTVTTLPTGLSISDVIYCAQVAPLSVGAWDWMLRNPTGFPNLPNPAPGAQYRSLNHHGNVIGPISAMGMRGSDLTPAKEYIERISAAEAYGSGWQQTFWATHQATVLALPQIV